MICARTTLTGLNDYEVTMKSSLGLETRNLIYPVILSPCSIPNLRLLLNAGGGFSSLLGGIFFLVRQKGKSKTVAMCEGEGVGERNTF